MRKILILTVLFAFAAMPAMAAQTMTDADQTVACDSCGCKAKAEKAADKPCGCKGECGAKAKADKPCDCKGKADCKCTDAEKAACGCGGDKADDKLACGCKKGECKCKKDAK